MNTVENTTKYEGRLRGLVAATCTPMHADASLNLQPIPDYVDYLIRSGVSGLYVAGSTGEGVSLTTVERQQLAEAFVQAARKRIPVVVQVGHNSIRESRGLAAHAQAIGADMISSTSPSYFNPDSVELLVDCVEELASGAPDLPFYYYHIPHLTGVPLDMVRFLEVGAKRIPTLAGIKFSDFFVPDFQACLEFDDRRFDILWGCDEMLLSGLVVGAEGAVGSTFNVAAPLYLDIMATFKAGDLTAARQQMFRAVEMVRLIQRHASVTVGLKEAVLPLYGFDFGSFRVPAKSMSKDAAARLQQEWVGEGFMDLLPLPAMTPAL